MTMASSLEKDLSSILAGHQGLTLPSATGLGALGSLGALAGGNNNESSLLTSLLLQKQAEDQQKAALLTQQLALGATTSPQDALLDLLVRKRQLESLQSVGAASSISRLLPLLGGSAASSAADAVLRQPPSQLETLTRLLSARQSVASLAPTGLNALSSASVIAGQQEQPQQRKRKGRTGTFPQKLHQILNDLQRQEGGSEIASFLPHGRAFAIFKPREFVQRVMPNYFRMSRFSSFQRQLNLYDFQRITDGPDKGAYYHELFVREQPMLSTMMKRNKIKGVKNNAFSEENGSPEDDGNSTNTQEQGDEEESSTKSSGK